MLECTDSSSSSSKEFLNQMRVGWSIATFVNSQDETGHTLHKRRGQLCTISVLQATEQCNYPGFYAARSSAQLPTLSASSATHCKPTLAGQTTKVPADCRPVGLDSPRDIPLSARAAEAESCLELLLRPRRRLLLRIRAMVEIVLPSPCTIYVPCQWKLHTQRLACSCCRCGGNMML